MFSLQTENYQRITQHAEGMSLRYGVIVLRNLTQLQPPTKKIMLLSGVFRRETASGFYPWGNVVSPRERVAEGLCGWRHGNSFPMTQSAQSLRQMRSIPRCSKAVFYVFVFDYIHNSITLHNVSPQVFHRSKKAQPITLIIQIQLFGQKRRLLKKATSKFYLWSEVFCF